MDNMALEQAILGFLADGPATGYELKTRCFDAAPRLFWTADQAQVYRSLSRLEKAGLVRSSRRRQSVRPDRRVFELTEQGREAARVWLASVHRVPEYRDPFLLQLYLSAPLSDEELLELLSSHRAAHQERLDRARATLTALDEDHPLTDRERMVRRCALEAVAAHERSAIDWLDDSIERLEFGATPATAPSVKRPRN